MGVVAPSLIVSVGSYNRFASAVLTNPVLPRSPLALEEYNYRGRSTFYPMGP